MPPPPPREKRPAVMTLMSRNDIGGGRLDLIRERISGQSGGGANRIPQLVDEILRGAANVAASDIHIESTRDGVLVRYRIEGQLLDVCTLPLALQANVFGRMKLISRVVTYKKRSPQDGRMADEGSGVGPVRAAFIPTLYGERVVLRLTTAARPMGIRELGLTPEQLSALQLALRTPQGTILVTGPCSSGKSTTIYAALRYLLEASDMPPSIATLEDPIEQEIDGASQTQVDPSGGLTFLSGLRTLLRMDPNVITLGEIRDDETAQTAIQAGLSGHLVISTLHAGSAAQVFSRLLHMKIEPFLLASSVTAVVAQRLVRRLCRSCAATVPMSLKTAEWLGKEGLPAEEGSATGCVACHYTGFHGRSGIFEVLRPDEAFREQLLNSLPTNVLHAAAVAAGMETLNERGRAFVRDHTTTAAEIARVLAE